jgi:hypothetical protein
MVITVQYVIPYSLSKFHELVNSEQHSCKIDSQSPNLLMGKNQNMTLTPIQLTACN